MADQRSLEVDPWIGPGLRAEILREAFLRVDLANERKISAYAEETQAQGSAQSPVHDTQSNRSIQAHEPVNLSFAETQSSFQESTPLAQEEHERRPVSTGRFVLWPRLGQSL